MWIPYWLDLMLGLGPHAEYAGKHPRWCMSGHLLWLHLCHTRQTLPHRVLYPEAVIWADWYITRLLAKLTPKGVVFSFLFCSVLFCSVLFCSFLFFSFLFFSFLFFSVLFFSFLSFLQRQFTTACDDADALMTLFCSTVEPFQ